MPSATMPTTVATGTRSPRMHGAPPICWGFTVMRVNFMTRAPGCRASGSILPPRNAHHVRMRGWAKRLGRRGASAGRKQAQFVSDRRDRGEVPIVLQQDQPVLDRDLRDQAIVAAAGRPAGTPAGLVQPRGRNVRLERVDGRIAAQARKALAPLL